MLRRIPNILLQWILEKTACSRHDILGGIRTWILWLKIWKKNFKTNLLYMWRHSFCFINIRMSFLWYLVYQSNCFFNWNFSELTITHKQMWNPINITYIYAQSNSVLTNKFFQMFHFKNDCLLHNTLLIFVVPLMHIYVTNLLHFKMLVGSKVILGEQLLR